MCGLNVGGQPPKAQAEHAGRQVRYPPRAKNDEPQIVGDQVQAPELLLRRPADPGPAVPRDMVQALADNAVEPKIVTLLHQTVPEPMLTCATGRSHRHLAKVNGGIWGQMNHNGRHVTMSKMEWSAPKSLCANHRTDKRIVLNNDGLKLTDNHKNTISPIGTLLPNEERISGRVS